MGEGGIGIAKRVGNRRSQVYRVKRKAKVCVWVERDGFVSGKKGHEAPCAEVWWGEGSVKMFDFCPHCGKTIKVEEKP